METSLEKPMRTDNTPIEGIVNATWISVGAALVLIMLGAVAALLPLAVGIAMGILIVWIVLFSGLAHLVHAWDARGHALFRWRLLVGMMYMAAAVYLILRPTYDLRALTLFIGGMFAVEAVLLLAGAYWMRRRKGSGWMALDAALTLLLAACILVMWPWTSPWMLGVLMGLDVIASGLVFLGLLRDIGVWRPRVPA
ncbi:MAG TPA: DUF308 domain-containing protein [Gammaproteobacteria bacterium]